MSCLSAESPSAPSQKEKAKVVSACYTCRKKKVKCSGQHPCLYCTRRELQCAFPVSEDRRLSSEAKIRELEARLALYERQTHPSEDGGNVDLQGSTSISDPTEIQNTPSARLFTMPIDTQRRPFAVSPTPNLTPRADLSPQRIETHFTLGSSQNFGNRIQDILEQRTTHSPRMSHTPQVPTSRFNLNGGGLFPDCRPPLQLRHRSESRPHPDLRFPSVAEAYGLLDTVLLYIGDAQHFFDARDLSDQLMIFYRNNMDDVQRTNIWYLHILLVFAIGKLLRGYLDETSGPPGFSLFNEALGLLPDITEIKAHGVAGIEILALIAVYYQNIDRKDDAATHIGLAFRLALLHKLYRKSTLDQLHPSQATHVNRVWWTVQMHDKRLTIATGCPLSLDDKMIASPLPSASPGFCAPLPIRLNIDIVQIQSRIYSVIYSNESCSEQTFCNNVRDIMSSLTQIAKEIPQNPPHSTVMNRDPSKLGIHTSISLFQMLYQAIILTLRPTLLHLTKLILDRETTFAKSSSALQQLARMCVEAARKNMELLKVLQNEDILSIFGFFDLDAIFSSSFVLLLAAIISPANTSGSTHFHILTSSPGIRDGVQLLDYLTGRRNHAARARRDQIQALHETLQAFTQGIHSSHGNSEAALTPTTVSNPVGVANADVSSSEADPYLTGASQCDDFMESYRSGTVEGEFVPVTLPVEFSDDPHAIYSLFHDDGFVLTGESQADFEELQRHFSWR